MNFTSTLVYACPITYTKFIVIYVIIYVFILSVYIILDSV